MQKKFHSRIFIINRPPNINPQIISLFMALYLVCQEREVKQNLKLEEKGRILVFHLTGLLLKHLVVSAFALCPPWPYKAGLH